LFLSELSRYDEVYVFMDVEVKIENVKYVQEFSKSDSTAYIMSVIIISPDEIPGFIRNAFRNKYNTAEFKEFMSEYFNDYDYVGFIIDRDVSDEFLATLLLLLNVYNNVYVFVHNLDHDINYILSERFEEEIEKTETYRTHKGTFFKVYNIRGNSVYFIDTLPFTRRSVEEIGKHYNLNKIEVKPYLVKDDPELTRKYVMRDSEIVAVYVLNNIKNIKSIVKGKIFYDKGFDKAIELFPMI